MYICFNSLLFDYCVFKYFHWYFKLFYSETSHYTPSFHHVHHSYVNKIYSIILYVNCMQIIIGFIPQLHITESRYLI